MSKYRGYKLDYNLILKKIYIKNNKHWLSIEKLENHWKEGSATITTKDALEAMKQVDDLLHEDILS